MDHAVTEGGHRFTSEERPSGRDDLAHGHALIESLCCAKVPLLDDEAVVGSLLEPRRDADAVYLAPKQATEKRSTFAAS